MTPIDDVVHCVLCGHDELLPEGTHGPVFIVCDACKREERARNRYLRWDENGRMVVDAPEDAVTVEDSPGLNGTSNGANGTNGHHTSAEVVP